MKAKTKILKLEMELFCQFYVKNTETFGNATQSYAEAYQYNLDELSKDDAVWGKTDGGLSEILEPSSYDKAVNVCAAQGARLLRNVKVQDRITVLLNEILEDKVVDAELAKVIMQNRELPAKMAAIREYNSIRKRTDNKLKLQGTLELTGVEINIRK